MWGFEHTLMASVAGLLFVALLVKGHVGWALAVALSQFPFWAGLLAYAQTGDSSPASVNAITNIIIAGTFAHIGSVVQEKGKPSASLMAICVILLVMATVDAVQTLTPLSVYVILQEGGHYAALVLIWKRNHVERLYRRFNRRVRAIDNDEGRDLA